MQNLRKYLILLFITNALSYSTIYAQNLLTNGDFESGGSGTGFLVTNYTLINPVNGTSTPGKYAITTNPNLMNSNYISSGDHSASGNGKMLVVDGSNLSNQFIWTTGNTGSPISGFTIGTNYIFSFWIKSVSNDVTNATQSTINVIIPVGASNINPLNTTVVAPLPAAGWQQVSFMFTATSNMVMIRLFTTSTSTLGNDFALDDFSITAGSLPLSLDITSTVNPTCPNSLDGSIITSAKFGNSPYNYTLTGPISATNSTGIFTGLNEGTYDITVKDGANKTETKQVVLTVPGGITVSPDVSTCAGSPTPLTVSGGSGGYTWTASPIDPTLTTPNSATITVSPSQTTTYTVTSGAPPDPTNFINNGDFSFGDSDFSTDYLPVANPNPFGVKGAYGIVTNPQAWFNPFDPCPDHTSGNGQMMVVDGSDKNGGNDRLWVQSVAVSPNQDYDFKYYIQTLTAGAPARIEVYINGVSLGAPINSPSSKCLWQPHTYTWNSGSNTTATITIYDRETSGGGNDFAIDDISLKKTSVCSFQKNVIITINSTLNLNITSPTPVCSPTTVDITDPAVTMGSSAGTLSYWTDVTATNPLTNANTISVSGTYYIKIDSGSCSVIKPVLVTINNSSSIATPAVNSPISYCQNNIASQLSAIPAPGATLNWYGTNQTGGIASATAPIPSTVASGKYYVSQTIGTCESPRTEIEVIVSPLLTPTFNTIPAVCQNAAAPILPTNSTNSPAISGTWSPSSVSTTTSGSTVYTFTPSSGSCYSPTKTTISITVNPGVAPNFATISTLCEGSVAPLLNSVSPNGISGTWLPAIIDNSTSGSYLFTPNATLFPCSPTQTLNVTVTPKVVTTVAPIAPLCKDALAPVLPTTSTNSPTINGTWNASIDTTIPGTKNYIFTPSVGVCATIANLSITINSKIIPSFDPVTPICSGTTLSALPTTSKNNISGSWLSAIDNTKTTTYTFTPNSGQCATNGSLTITVTPNSIPTFNPVPDICLGAVLSPLPLNSTNGISGTWSPALDNTKTTTYTFKPSVGQCATTTQLTISINSGSTITPLFSSISPICFGQIVPKLPTTSLNNIIGIWTPEINPNATTTYTFTPNEGQCAASTTQQIIINQLPSVETSNDSFTICSGSSTAISLSSNTAGTTFTWNVVQANVKGGNASSGSVINQLLSTAGNKPGEAIYSIEPLANGCPGPSKLVSVTVNPVPEVSANPTEQVICSGETSSISLSSTVAKTTFSWTVTPNIILGTSASTGDSISQTLVNTALLADNAIYNITPSAYGCLGTPISVPITVNPAPEVFASGKTTICSEEYTNIVLKSNILGTDFSWTAFQTGVSGAKSGTGNVIEDVLKTGINIGTAVYTITPTLEKCKGNPINITIKVNPLPNPSLLDGTVCLENGTDILINPYRIESGLVNPNFDFEWFLNKTKIISATENSYEATQEGVYSLIVTDNLTSCISKDNTVTVTKSYPANSFTTVVSDAFTENATITVIVQGGNSNLLYQIDGGELQRSNVFTNVNSGIHTITVLDELGCTNLTQDVLIIDYPKYFTPNGDGSNDKWNIVELNNQYDSKIFIYDRYGKLLKQISTKSEGWDGTFNGYELPATDYWFTIDYLENNINKVFKAHFSLKR